MSEPHRDSPEIAPLRGPIPSDQAWALMLNGLMLMVLSLGVMIWVILGFAGKFREIGYERLLHEAGNPSKFFGGLALIFGGFALYQGGVAFFKLGWKLFQQGRTAPRLS